MSSDPALRYKSPSTVKSLWQEYRIYDDHIELDTHFGMMAIPFEMINTMNIRPSDLRELVTKGDLQLKGFRPALKLDWANFQEHVILDKDGGLIKRILFTPDDPQAFQTAFKQAFEEFQRKPG